MCIGRRKYLQNFTTQARKEGRINEGFRTCKLLLICILKNIRKNEQQITFVCIICYQEPLHCFTYSKTINPYFYKKYKKLDKFYYSQKITVDWTNSICQRGSVKKSVLSLMELALCSYNERLMFFFSKCARESNYV